MTDEKIKQLLTEDFFRQHGEIGEVVLENDDAFVCTKTGRYKVTEMSLDYNNFAYKKVK